MILQRFVPLLSASFCLATVAAQSARTMHLMAPVVLGETARFELRHPFQAVGNAYAFLASAPPYTGALTVAAPGLAVTGQLRVDPAAAFVAYTGVLGLSGRAAHDLPVPGAVALLGFAFDLQGVDVGLAAATLQFTANDLTLVVASQPPLGMLPIPAGTFTMGSNVTATEAPVHPVTISRPFWMGRYEVTQAEFQARMGYNPSMFVGPNRPVEVSWNQATAYCAALQAQEAAAGRVPSGYVYRLPTEAEWEYACRAGTTTAYHYGATIDCTLANAFHELPGPGFCLPGGQTAVVGSYPPNAFGLHDMHGNVYEWCLDRWPGAISSYPSAHVTDPLETNPLFIYRIARGGAYYFWRDEARSASRQGNLPDTWVQFFGFRVVLGPVL